MKLLLKLILILCFVLLGTYAAAPLWLPYILAGQLPPGWKLEEMQSGYPGVGGIDVDQIRIEGEHGAADIKLRASGIRLQYRGLKTAIGSVNVDVQVNDFEEKSAGSFTLDELSLPVAALSGKFPPLSIGKMDVVLHRVTGLHDEAYRPVRLGLEDIVLTPRPGQAYKLTSRVTIARAQHLNGQFDAEISPDQVDAMIRFTSDANDTAWLTLEIEQAGLQGKTTSHLRASLDSSASKREWLDSLLASGSKQVFTQLGGNLQLEASFAGQGLQSIETVALVSDKLRLVTQSGTLDLSANLVAKREGKNIAIELPGPASIQYLGNIDRIDDTLNRIIPGLELTHGADTKILSELGAGSRFSFRPGSEPSIGFDGDLRLKLASEFEDLTLHSSGIQIGVNNLLNPGSITTDGLILFAWELKAPLAYSYDDLRFEADELSIAGELTTRDGKLVSKGGGTLRQARVTTHDVFAEEIDLAWRELDLINLTGQLETRTNGFSAEFDQKTWAGFDFDVNYELPGNNDVIGEGAVKFTTGQNFPIEFDGNTGTQRWNIELLPVDIQLANLAKLLSSVHYQLPESIKLTDGYIQLKGDVMVDDEITARLRVSGHEVTASMLKSSARQTRFTFDSGYDAAPWASGPVNIDAITLAGGIEASNFSSEFELERAGPFTLRNVSAELFDGDLKLGRVHFSGDQIEDTTIELNHINLGLLLKFANIDGLAGSGFLDISLPVGSDLNGFHVQDGSFSSNGPGRLAYTKEGIAGSNIGLQALENFQYKELSGTLNYESDGNYRISIRLEGKNPDLYDGHPVVFNLNVSGLLPEFFEAMFMTGSFEESILKQIKSQ
jgi:hypothetical protein